MTLKTRSSHIIPGGSLARLTFCWSRHNRLAMTSQWPDNCDANTWQVIFNSLDIDFIHGYIHGRSCKKESSFQVILWHQWWHIITMKYHFSGIIWDDFLISEINWKLCLIFWHFQHGCHFDVATNFFTGRDTGSWICQKDSHNHFRHFKNLILAIAEILLEI